MSAFEWVVLVWLVFLTIRSVAGQSTTRNLSKVLVDSGLAEPQDRTTRGKCTSSSAPDPSRRGALANIPFLSAGVIAVKEARTHQEENPNG